MRISPTRCDQLPGLGELLLRQLLARVGRKLRADVAECSVDAAGYSAHACGRRQGDKRYNECILDEVLTFFPIQQVLNLD